MTVVNIELPSKSIPPDRFSLFELGFRPFFLLAGLAAILLIAGWVLLLISDSVLNNYYGLALWHGHEMVFGFAVAVIAGFLLTAVRNWTNVQTVKGPGLAALVLLWLLGRVVAFFPDMLPAWLIALVDLAFLPLLAVALAIPILRSNKKPQLAFVVVLLLMFGANFMMHLNLLEITASGNEAGMNLAMNCVLLIIVIMAGRVVPFFIEKGAPGATPRKWPWLERLALATMLLFMLGVLFEVNDNVIALLAAIAALVHGLRLWGWHSKHLWQVPLLWVLLLGYAWLVLGFVLTLFVYLGLLTPMLALHAFAAAIGVLCLGMMSRVALGHTGRLLQPAKVMAWAFALINLAMLLRVSGPLFVPALEHLAVMGAAILWIAAFAIFIWIYAPILIRARVDGKPG